MKFLRKYGRIGTCILVIALVLVMFEMRLFQWQVVEYNDFKEDAEDSGSLFVKLEAGRGEILDKDGNVLAGNRTVYNVVMNALYIESDRNPAILSALNLFRENGVKWIDKLPIKIDENGEYVFIENRGNEISFLKSSSFLNVDEDTSAEECMRILTERYRCSSYSKEDARDIISVRYNMTKTQFSLSSPYVMAEDVSIEVVELISELFDKMPGVEIRVSGERYYEDGDLAPHIVGSMGLISADQYKKQEENGNTYSSENVQGYAYNDYIGQSGVEMYFEDILRGENGKEEIYLDSNGTVISTEITEEMETGHTVFLTLDSELQKVANESLERNVKLASVEHEDCVAGAVVVLDVETFGVLAAASYPSYDIDLYQSDEKYYLDLINDETRPLFNRAFDGMFTPGSVFKPLVAIAALNEGVINSGSIVECTGVYDFYEEESPPTCLGIHEKLNVFDALKKSCNIFFYDVGRRVTIDTIGVYADLFGLGKKTGIEVSETSGIMSGKEEYLLNHSTRWVDGLTLQASIGQCDSMFSPLQLATYCATIANDGVRLKTHIMSKITDYSGEKIIESYTPTVEETIAVDESVLDIVQYSMSTVADYGGTAYKVFGDYKIKIAAKTGTAEVPGHTDNTVFIAYAPYDDPQIAVAVVIEYGKDGVYSQSVAKDIFDMYFFGETEDYGDEEPELIIPEIDLSSEDGTRQESNINQNTDTDSDNTDDSDIEGTSSQSGNDDPDGA
ncbi:MAG: penicillin-binding protein [Ruminococcaceae bacterium]|nr:penicillin-binding protein [Oscillospiraceae bacterium]